jgi:Flp pilus assembly protein TadG
MLKSKAASLRKLVLSAQGAEIAETAMILPLLFVMIMAIYWFGQAFRIYGTITNAARDGARAAVAPACATCSATTPVQNAVTAVNAALTAAHLNPALANAPAPAPTFLSCNGTAPSCQTVSGSNVCVYQNVQLSSTANGGAGSCGTSVNFSYKYPFHFTLPCWPQPCTSIDLSKITLPAQAEMRQETQ